MGAVDVIPFTPWGGETMDTCVALARKVGEQVAKGYSLPVYLYGEAALIPEHRDLLHIRRGGYEQLLQDIHRVSDRQPDFGLARVHPSLGAVAIGARKPLVAFNVNLKTDNVVVAKQIAARMKGENGGLSYIKAIGVNLKSRGMVQVAMNLLDFTKSTVVQAYELVRLEARRYGVEVHGAEIIGLVPLECLVDIVGFYLSIPDLKVSQVLEYQLLEKNI
jgi:glutamate formiminotransferase